MEVGVGSQRKRVILDFYATPVQNSTILEARLCNTADVWRPVIVHTHQLWIGALVLLASSSAGSNQNGACSWSRSPGAFWLAV